jgi:G3E family GTPase
MAQVSPTSRRIDTMVTVVDAVNLLKDYASKDFLEDRGEVAGEGDTRALVSLLAEQIEFADVIIVNKVGSATPEQRKQVRTLIASLNPDAKVIETNYADVPLDEVLNTGRFDFAKAHEHPLWAKELFGYASHTPETEAYGIESFVYRARKPFHPERLYRFFSEEWSNVIRAKGHFWIATRPAWMGEVSKAGTMVQHQGLGRWWASVPRSRWPEDEQSRQFILDNWDPEVGDRRQELVFIGVGMDKAAITARLDACLTDVPRGLDKPGGPWRPKPMRDPFPVWGQS